LRINSPHGLTNHITRIGFKEEDSFPHLTKVYGAVALLVEKVEHLLGNWCSWKVKCRKELLKGNITTAITAEDN
jgi:hypothetical protein